MRIALGGLHRRVSEEAPDHQQTLTERPRRGAVAKVVQTDPVETREFAHAVAGVVDFVLLQVPFFLPGNTQGITRHSGERGVL